MISEADRSKKTLESKFGKGLQASKRRDAEEKAESAKRALRDDSSDEEGGRSSLGKKKKKLKVAEAQQPAKQVEEVKEAEKIRKSKIAAVQEPTKQVDEVKEAKKVKKVKKIKKAKELKKNVEDKSVKIDTMKVVKEPEQAEHGSKKVGEGMAEVSYPIHIFASSLTTSCQSLATTPATPEKKADNQHTKLQKQKEPLPIRSKEEKKAAKAARKAEKKRVKQCVIPKVELQGF